MKEGVWEKRHTKRQYEEETWRHRERSDKKKNKEDEKESKREIMQKEGRRERRERKERNKETLNWEWGKGRERKSRRIKWR